VPGLPVFDPLTVPDTGYQQNWNASYLVFQNLDSVLVPEQMDHSPDSDVGLNLGSNSNHY